MNKALAAAVSVLLAGALLSPASAYTSPDTRWVPAVYFDVLAPGNQLTHLRDQRGTLCRGPEAAGQPCSGQFRSYAALGGRVGLYNESEDYRWGGSVGILSGGPDRGRVEVNTQSPAGSVSFKTASTTVRVLGEATQKFLITDDLYGGLGAGLGMAVTNQTLSCTGFGAPALACGRLSGTRNFGWVAWELVPSLIYQELELGLRFAGFARGGRAPWNTWGATVGFRFL
jgi:hypothetical protein